MAVSSIGIGSGLDVENIISQMVALEKSSITTLETKADKISTKISTYGEIKSKVDALNTAVGKLTRDSGWNGVNLSSSSSSVTASMTGIASTGTYSLNVTQLASSQTSVSTGLASGTKMGSAGKLQFTVGDSATPIEVSVGANDTLTTVAASINTAAGGSLVASVVTNSAGKQQLMIRAKDTGEDGAFTITAAGGSTDPLLATLGFSVSQTAENALITLNGVEVSSSSNTFADVIPGVSFTVSGLTTGALLTATQDTASMQANIQAFVDAYNELNDLLSTSTKYDSDTETAGVLQGDSSTVSLQNALRMLTQRTANSSGAFTRLADIGIEMQQGGTLSVDSTKLTAALKNPDALKSLFATKADALGNGGGMAVNFKTFTDGLLSLDGTLNTKTDSLEEQLEKNGDEQDKVNKRADTLEARLRAQYTALDTKMASLSSLSSYVEQMVASWNKSSD